LNGERDTRFLSHLPPAPAIPRRPLKRSVVHGRRFEVAPAGRHTPRSGRATERWRRAIKRSGVEGAPNPLPIVQIHDYGVRFLQIHLIWHTIGAELSSQQKIIAV